MRKVLREKAIYLRTKKRMSYGQIKEQLNVPKSTLSYWLKDYPLSEKEIFDFRSQNWSKGEASREKYRRTMRLKKEEKYNRTFISEKKKLKNIKSRDLYLAGLMLYLGEGAKKRDSSLVLANSDPRIIKFFMWWLEKFLEIPKREMKVQLHLYEDMNLKREKGFWKKYLGMSDDQIYKLSVRKIQKNSFSYSGSFRHGTCSLYAFGVDNVRRVTAGINAMLDSYQ